MKSILISIRPEWVKKILKGDKTIEIRKTIPKCELPVKCYIYCTKDKGRHLVNVIQYGRNFGYYCVHKNNLWRYKDIAYDRSKYLNGKVVAEFTLNKITKHEKNYIDVEDRLCYNFTGKDVKKAGFVNSDMDDWEKLDAYIEFDSFVTNYGNGKPLYAWHIDNLKIYDKPKELNQFQKDLDCDDYPCNKNYDCPHHYYDTSEECWACGIDFDGTHCIFKQLKRPPRSWCYVEEA